MERILYYIITFAIGITIGAVSYFTKKMGLPGFLITIINVLVFILLCSIAIFVAMLFI